LLFVRWTPTPTEFTRVRAGTTLLGAMTAAGDGLSAGEATAAPAAVVAEWLGIAAYTGNADKPEITRPAAVTTRSRLKGILTMRGSPLHACEMSCRIRARRCPAVRGRLHP
jgi:hypothetical protein